MRRSWRGYCIPRKPGRQGGTPPGAGGSAAPVPPPLGGTNWTIHGGNLKVIGLYAETMKLLLSFAGTGSQQAGDAISQLATKLNAAAAANSAASSVATSGAATPA